MEAGRISRRFVHAPRRFPVPPPGAEPAVHRRQNPNPGRGRPESQPVFPHRSPPLPAHHAVTRSGSSRRRAVSPVTIDHRAAAIRPAPPRRHQPTASRRDRAIAPWRCHAAMSSRRHVVMARCRHRVTRHGATSSSARRREAASPPSPLRRELSARPRLAIPMPFNRFLHTFLDKNIPYREYFLSWTHSSPRWPTRLAGGL